MERPADYPKLENYTPTRFMLPTSHYDEEKADRAVKFIEMLPHTKGEWEGKSFWLLDWQSRIIRDLFGVVKEDGTRQFRTAYIEIPKKNGKQLALDTPIPTPEGFTNMGDLRVGDTVFDEQGRPCHVVAKSAVDDTEQAYRITFRDGSSIIAGERHLWNCEYLYGRSVQWTTGEIYRETAEFSNPHIRIPVSKPLQTKDVDLPVDPYLYGYCLGSENENSIPPKYLRASEKQRWALLQGIMDTDGYIRGGKAPDKYCSTIEGLALSVSELLWSLGIRNSVSTMQNPTGETQYVVRFFRQSSSRLKNAYHYIKDIQPLPQRVKMQCIQVDSPSHQYLAGTSMVPTHNSELAAAIALYLLYADNEPSAEVFSAAADRAQASIVMDVAKRMVEMTPALMKRSKIMGATKRIVNYSNAGYYQVVSADVSNKHGYSISGLVFDELHTQPNRQLWDVLTKGSGDARRQALHVAITTAGTDQNSICYELHCKALDLLSGKKHDPTFYPVVYSLPIDAPWDDEESWRSVNPSLGVTFPMDRMREAFLQAQENPAEENVFRQLRLCQWVGSSVAWIPDHIYDKGNIPINLESLKGRECYCGLDLSSTSDITAFVMVFPPQEESGKYIVLPHFWLPRDTLELRVKRDRVPYDIWEKQGLFHVTEGNVVDYNFVRKTINELYHDYNIKEIGADRWNASQLITDLQGDGFTIVPIGMGFKDMSPGMKELYKLFLEGRIIHGGNPVLKWMAGNVVAEIDAAENTKPSKKKSTEKIDGIVALIMGLDRAIRHEKQGSVYDDPDHGLLSF